jgi:WD40 repeat protein
MVVSVGGGAQNRTFRVFVSSTFLDLRDERDALQREVYPRLSRLCRGLGASFQAIDLRWGIRAETAEDRRTLRTCLSELARCQQTSPRPNFLVLLGDRYGWQPLPEVMPIACFERIAAALDGEGDLGATFRAQYRRDDNAVPPVVELTPGSSSEPGDWYGEVEAPLILAIRKLPLAQLLEPRERHLFETSATHQEILAGALAVPDASDHVFAVFRDIDNIETLLTDSAAAVASGLLDIARDTQPDVASRARQLRLRERLAGHLGADNVARLRATWSPSGLSQHHLGTLPTDFERCLDLLDEVSRPRDLCSAVWWTLGRTIRRQLADATSLPLVAIEDKLHSEHRDAARDGFHGRAAELQRVAACLDGHGDHILVVTGPPGVGKTALLSEALANREDQAGPLCIARIVGATPGSSDPLGLLGELYRALALALETPERDLPAELGPARCAVEEALADAAIRRPVVLVIDGVDQVGADPDPFWLPTIPPGVRLVVSCSMEGPALDLPWLARRLPGAANLVLGPLDTADAAQALDAWLRNAGRTLQAAQREALLQAFAQTGLPLWLRLAMLEACTWASHHGVPRYREHSGLAPGLEGLIHDLIWRLAQPAWHGPKLAFGVVAYLAASRRGLAEEELLGALAADTDVMTEIEAAAVHRLSEVRVPVATWVRLRNDLAPLLAEQQVDGVRLVSIQHRAVRDMLRRIPLGGHAGAERHRALACWFEGQPLFEAGRPQPRPAAELAWQWTEARSWADLNRVLTNFEWITAKCGLPGGVEDLLADLARAREAAPSEHCAPWQLIEEATRMEATVLRASPELAAQQVHNALVTQTEANQDAARVVAAAASHQRGRPWFRLLEDSPLRPAGAESRVLLTTEGEVKGLASHPSAPWVVTWHRKGATIWNLDDRRQWDVIAATADRVRCVGWVSGGGQLVVVHASGRVRSFADDGRSERSEWRLPSAPERAWLAHGEPVLFVETGAGLDAHDAVTGALISRIESTLSVLAVASVEPRRVVLGGAYRDEERAKRQRASSSWADQAAFGAACVWDLGRGTLDRLGQAEDEMAHLKSGQGPVTALAVSTDGRLCALGDDTGCIRVLDTRTGRETHHLPNQRDWYHALRGSAASSDGPWGGAGHDQPISALAFVGGILVSAAGQPHRVDRAGELCRWDLERRRQLTRAATPGAIVALAALRDGRRFVAGGRLRLAVEDALPPPGRTGRVVLEPGELLDVATLDPLQLRVALPRGPDILVRRPDEPEPDLEIRLAHFDEITCLAIAPTTGRLASAARDGGICLWESTTGERLHDLDLPDGKPCRLSFSPDGRRLAATGEGSETLLVSLPTAGLIRLMSGSAAPGTALAINADAVLRGRADGGVELYSPANPTAPRAGPAHAAPVQEVRFAASGHAVTGSRDGCLRSWEPASCAVNWSWTAPSGFLDLCPLLDDTVVAIGDQPWCHLVGPQGVLATLPVATWLRRAELDHVGGRLVLLDTLGGISCYELAALTQGVGMTIRVGQMGMIEDLYKKNREADALRIIDKVLGLNTAMSVDELCSKVQQALADDGPSISGSMFDHGPDGSIRTADPNELVMGGRATVVNLVKKRCMCYSALARERSFADEHGPACLANAAMVERLFPDNADLLTLASQAYLATYDMENCARLLGEAAAIQPGHPMVKAMQRFMGVPGPMVEAARKAALAARSGEVVGGQAGLDATDGALEPERRCPTCGGPVTRFGGPWMLLVPAVPVLAGIGLTVWSLWGLLLLIPSVLLFLVLLPIRHGKDFCDRCDGTSSR